MTPHEQSRYLLRIGDTCLILGHRMSELMGHAPVLEEDLSIANIALEQIDQARAWLTLAGQLEGQGRDEDALAYFRNQSEFFNATLAEQPNGHFGDTVARALLLCGWQHLWYVAASDSNNSQISKLAKKFAPQAQYHWQWARDWTLRLGDGTELSHQRSQQAIDALWKFTGELFDADPLDTKAAAAQVGPAPESLHDAWLERLDATLTKATLKRPSADTLRWHGKRGEHSEQLSLLLAEMQSLARAHPGAQW